jgi:hypothetical protein
MMGTHWEQEKKEKIPCPPFSKRKKMDHSHWLHEISLSKNVHHQYFAWAALMPILKDWGYLFC